MSWVIRGKSSDYVQDLPTLKGWVMHNRSFQGNVRLVHLGGALILSDFEMISNEEIVKKMFMGKLLFLERWSPSVGRLRNGVCLSEI